MKTIIKVNKPIHW